MPRPVVAAENPADRAPAVILMPWAVWSDWLHDPRGAAPPDAWQARLGFVLLFCALVDFLKMIVELVGRGEDRAYTSDPTLVTAVLPTRNGAEVLPGTLADLARILPPERMLVIDDGSTDDSGGVARRFGCAVHRFEHSKGKAAAIHYAVWRVTTPYALLLDDDTRLGGAAIPTSLLSRDGFDAVALHVLPDRRDRDGAHGHNFLGDLQRYEYGKSMEIGRRFHDATHSVSCVSGAVGLFRTRDLNAFHHDHTGAFPGEDLQRTMIHLLRGKRIVFANQPAWTVAPGSWGAWCRQRVFGWYPGLYHQLRNIVRLMFRRGVSWRLRYEMAYNLYTFVSDPLKTFSIVVLALTPGLRGWLVVIYLVYLAFEVYAYWAVRIPGSDRHVPLRVLLVYPIYGGINTVLRTVSLFTWFWMRYVTHEMRPRRGPKDRIP
jgi:glycosyltransferase involved in cell wall biosynthesis